MYQTIAYEFVKSHLLLNQFYGLTDCADGLSAWVSTPSNGLRTESTASSPSTRRCRYVDQRGSGRTPSTRSEGDAGGSSHNSDRQGVIQTPFFTAVRALEAHHVYMSPLGPTMTAAMPVYQPGGEIRCPPFWEPCARFRPIHLQEFQRTARVITLWFVILTALSLRVALFLTIINRLKSGQPNQTTGGKQPTACGWPAFRYGRT